MPIFGVAKGAECVNVGVGGIEVGGLWEIGKLPDNVALAPPEDSDGLQTGFMLANITYAAGVIMCRSRQLIGKTVTLGLANPTFQLK